MLTLMSYLATALYLGPLALALAARSRHDRPLWEIALDIPLLAAIDLLGVLLLSRLVTLETAILASRGLWLAGGIAGLVLQRRRGQLRWPAALGPRALTLTALAAVLAVLLSMALSRQCHNADRAWHIPLVSSLQAQRIPFANVYEPQRALAYHFTGDVFAAMFQTLSLRVLHASLALSLAHDVAFGLTGATIALLALWMRHERVLPVALATLGTLLAGPLTLLRPDATRPGGGYNFINYLKLSFRPHVCLAGLLMVGFLGVVLVNLRESREHPVRRTAPVLLACTALLAVTDEASIGVLGLSLGVTWLLAPEVVHPRRLPGVLLFAGLAAAVIVPNIVYVGSLAPGNPRHELSLVPWRSPGYFHPVLPLSNARGWSMLQFDLFPMAAALAGGGLSALRRWTRERVVTALFFAALMGISILGLCKLDVDKLPVESHRFITAAMFLFPLLAAFWVSPRGEPAPGLRLLGDALAPAILLAAVSLSALSTLEWLRSTAATTCTKPSKYRSRHEFFTTNCAVDAGGRLGERPAPTYMEDGIFYVHAGCHPIFAAGPKASHWALKVGLAKFGEGALRELHRDMIPAGAPLRVICPTIATADPVCKRAQDDGTCRPLGEKTAACEVSPAARLELLAAMDEKASEKKAKGTTKEPKGRAEPADDSADTPGGN